MNRMPAECFPVGHFLREEMAARGWTPADVAARIAEDAHARKTWALTVELVLECSGMEGVHIGADTAAALSRVFGTSPQFWLDLDNAYREWAKSQMGLVTPKERT